MKPPTKSLSHLAKLSTKLSDADRNVVDRAVLQSAFQQTFGVIGNAVTNLQGQIDHVGSAKNKGSETLIDEARGAVLKFQGLVQKLQEELVG